MRRYYVRRRNTFRRREDRYRVLVRRDRPAHLAWAIALLVTMLMVYLATLSPQTGLRARSASASPKVTREVTFDRLEMYLVSLYDCATAEEARMLASGYTGRGAAGYVCEMQERWQVFGAAYEEKRDADRIAERLSEDEGLGARAVSVSAGKVEMRITAPDIQIAAIVEANALLNDQTEQLGRMALQLDRNEMDAGTARTLCAVASTRTSAAAEILNAIPGSKENALCGGLVKRLNTLSGLLNSIADNPGSDTATLSGMLRCAQIDTFLGQVEMQKGLAG